MHRLVLAVGAATLTLTAVACGSGAAATNSAGASSTPDAGGSPGARGFRGGSAGEVVKINGSGLVLNTQQGDVNVDFSSSTTVSRTSTGVLADITPGVCLAAQGTKDGSGAFTASTVSITNPVNGSCTGGGILGGVARPSFSPDPSFSPNPNRTPRAGQRPAVRGQVTAVDGVSITITQLGGAASGQSTTITVPTTVTVNKTAAATTGDIAVGDCVAAIGQKDSSGAVQARALSIQPAGPTGCFTGGRGGIFFGGGGGGGGGGAGGGG